MILYGRTGGASSGNALWEKVNIGFGDQIQNKPGDSPQGILANADFGAGFNPQQWLTTNNTLSCLLQFYPDSINIYSFAVPGRPAFGFRSEPFGQLQIDKTTQVQVLIVPPVTTQNGYWALYDTLDGTLIGYVNILIP